MSLHHSFPAVGWHKSFVPNLCINECASLLSQVRAVLPMTVLGKLESFVSCNVHSIRQVHSYRVALCIGLDVKVLLVMVLS